MLAKKILTLHESLEEVERLREHLHSLDLRRKDLQRVHTETEKLVAKEYRDVEKLDKSGIGKLVRNLKGTEDEVRTKEMEEYDQSIQALKRVEKDLELLEFEYKVLLDKKQKLAAQEKEFKQLIEQKIEELKATGPNGLTGQIRQITDQAERIEQQLALIKANYQNTGEAIKLVSLAAHLWRQGGQMPQYPNHPTHIRHRLKIMLNNDEKARQNLVKAYQLMKNPMAYLEQKYPRRFTNLGNFVRANSPITVPTRINSSFQFYLRRNLLQKFEIVRHFPENAEAARRALNEAYNYWSERQIDGPGMVQRIVLDICRREVEN